MKSVYKRNSKIIKIRIKNEKSNENVGHPLGLIILLQGSEWNSFLNKS
jgi:hypothetical protein